jgi:hypothetical protein
LNFILWNVAESRHSIIGKPACPLAVEIESNLFELEGRKPSAYSGKNDETFSSFDSKTWAETVKRLDRVMKNWERAVEQADDTKLKAAASRIAHIGAHNAYHLGQIIYVRKLQGV